MTTAVRWGILGAAKFAQEHMAPAIHAAKGAELAALASTSPQKAAEFQRFCPNLHVYSDYEKLLADPTIEAVYIPLPNHLHVEWTLRALNAGKHVLCEKPIALRAEQIAPIIAARDATGLLAAEAYMIVHHPQWQLARTWLAAGEIGTLRHVDANFSYNNEAEPENIRNRPETGGGSLRDIGVYTLGSCRFVTGAEPVSVSSRIRRENNVEVYAEVNAVMRAGQTAPFTFRSMTSMRLFNRQEVAFQGDKGMIRLGSAPYNANVHDVAQVELHKPDQTLLVHRFPTQNQYVLQVEAFSHSIRTGEPYPCPLEFVHGTQVMMDMALDNAHELSL